MTNSHEKIFELSNIDIDFDEVISKITKTIVSQNINGKPITEDMGMAYWQKYNSQISFANKFYQYFPNECHAIVNILEKIRYDLHQSSNVSEYLQYFLSATFVPNRVNFIKTPAGVDVQPHIDINRNLCVNIGIKGSSTAITYVGETDSIVNFWKQDLNSYQMNDGDVYMLNVKKAHAVKSVANKSDRYLISYTLY